MFVVGPTDGDRPVPTQQNGAIELTLLSVYGTRFTTSEACSDYF